MRLVVNARTVVPGKLDGMGWYTYEIGRRLVEMMPDVEHHWLFDRAVQPSIVPPGVAAHVVYPPARHPVLWHLWHQYRVPRVIRHVRADVYWSPDGFIPLSTTIPTIATLHDIAYEHERRHTKPLAGAYYRWMLPKCARRASQLVTVSESARADIATTYGIAYDSIAVVPNGVRSTFLPTDSSRRERIRLQLNDGRPYVLHVGTIQPRKNIARLIEAFTEFSLATGANADLICAGGRGWENSDVESARNASALRDRIRFTGYIDDGQLADWYAGASMLAFVPLLEGFGVPIVEAFASGTPVVTSRRSPMSDIAGGAAVLADPEDVSSIASALTRLWLDINERERCIQRGLERAQLFSWDASAHLMVEIIRSVATRPTVR